MSSRYLRNQDPVRGSSAPRASSRSRVSTHEETCAAVPQSFTRQRSLPPRSRGSASSAGQDSSARSSRVSRLVVQIRPSSGESAAMARATRGRRASPRSSKGRATSMKRALPIRRSTRSSARATSPAATSAASSARSGSIGCSDSTKCCARPRGPASPAASETRGPTQMTRLRSMSAWRVGCIRRGLRTSSHNECACAIPIGMLHVRTRSSGGGPRVRRARPSRSPPGHPQLSMNTSFAAQWTASKGPARSPLKVP
jgi:hypothetical protein